MTPRASSNPAVPPLDPSRGSDTASWWCVQSGHRERYGVPRALHRVGALERLVTDVWAPPDSWVLRMPLGRVGRRLADRFHADLPDSRITAFTLRTLAWEAAATLKGLKGDPRGTQRTRWWTALASRALHHGASPSTKKVFTYCYEAHDLFVVARRLGLAPVLGQIDPGPVEDRKVAGIVSRWPAYKTSFLPGAQAYYDSWREECRLARHIIVNSEWSKSSLVAEGIDAAKLVVCPLVYAPPDESRGWRKEYPSVFSKERPLRVLFLGQCILRKGIAETIEAAGRLADRPVEFILVGNTDVERLDQHFKGARIRHYPRVSRSECHEFYRNADVFLFPTHSDGFGLTQLEAQAWRLPLIASPFCAGVTEHGRTGWVLPEVSSSSIVRVIEEILNSPAMLSLRSREIAPWPYTLDTLGRQLEALDTLGAERP